jgi:hypothetical protein
MLARWSGGAILAECNLHFILRVLKCFREAGGEGENILSLFNFIPIISFAKVPIIFGLNNIRNLLEARRFMIQFE